MAVTLICITVHKVLAVGRGFSFYGLAGLAKCIFSVSDLIIVAAVTRSFILASFSGVLLSLASFSS